jgi:hypothetical protein
MLIKLGGQCKTEWGEGGVRHGTVLSVGELTV